MSPRRRRGALSFLKAFVLGAFAVVVLLGLIAVIRIQTFPVGALARSAPERTAMMKQREREARKAGKALRIDQRWVPYTRVSPTLRRAILIAEDDKFFSHEGLDWDEIQASARKNLEERKVVRGGSTVTQQLAKNLFLGDARTLTRKFEEAFLAIRLERALPKRRIFELYLNLIEWGDGIFGAEAAARRYFGVSAAGLNERQAVLLAAVIINPRRFSVLQPNRRIERRVRLIASRMRRRGFLTPDQYAAAIGSRAEPPKQSLTDWFFGGGDPKPAQTPALETPSEDPVPIEPSAPDSAAPDSTPRSPTGAETSESWGTRRTPLERLPRELRAGEVVEIRWESPPADVEEMELLLSIDDGRHFTLRISPEIDPGTRRFRWRVPNLGTETARIAMRVGREARRERETERSVPNAGTRDDGAGAARGRYHEEPAGRGRREESARREHPSRHDEVMLAPSVAFRIVADPAAPPARFALREGWTWVGDESEPAAPAAVALSRPAAEWVVARDGETAESPPRAPLMVSPVAPGPRLHSSHARASRRRALLLRIPLRFVPLRN